MTIDSSAGRIKELDFGTSISKAFLGERDSIDDAYTDFSVFVERVLKSEDTGLPVVIQPFQREVIAALESKAKVVLLVLPRGYAKTSLVTIAYVAWRIGRDRNLRCIVASNIIERASSHLEGIDSLLSSRDYQEIFGNLKPESRKVKWTETIKYVIRDRKMRHPTLLAAGVGSAGVLGSRSDLILADDLIDMAHADSAAERDKAWHWFTGQLWYTLSPEHPEARVIVIATRFHHDDIAARLRQQYAGASTDEFIDIDIPALKVNLITNEEESIWESRFPAAMLKQMRERNYFSFQSHFQNDPIDASQSQLLESWLNYASYDDIAKLFPEMEFFVGVDPNTDVESIKKDFFAMVVVGVHHKSKRIFVVDMLYTKADLQTLKEQFGAKVQRWKPTKILLESNAAQGLYETILGKGEYLNYPFERIYSSLKKEQRILATAAPFMQAKVSVLGERDESGRWRPVQSLEPLRREWITFPHARDSHFDALDALGFALKPLVYFAQDLAVSIISPDEFMGRTRDEQLIRRTKEDAVKLQADVAAKLGEISQLANPTPEPEETDGQCAECGTSAKLRQYSGQEKEKLCYICYVDRLEDDHVRSFRPKVLMGTLGTYGGRLLR